MPEGWSIAFGVIGAIGTIAGIFGLTSYFTQRAKHKADLRNAQEDEQKKILEEAQQTKREETIRRVLKEEIQPLKKELEDITKQLTDNTKATITTLRCDMKDCRDRYMDRKYATASEKAAYNDLYNDYKDLGGNHFKNYVDQWKEDVEKLPNEKKKTKSKK